MQPSDRGTQYDKDTMVAGLRLARSIFQTPTMQRITTEEFWPGRARDSDADWLEHVKNTGSTTFHQTSTCMMGPGPVIPHEQQLVSRPDRRSRYAARGRTISALMNQCSRHTTAGTTSHQRSTLPTNRQGHDLTSGLNVQGLKVLTCRRLPTVSLPDDRLTNSH